MWGLDLRNGTKVDRDKMGVYSTELFTDEAIRKIRQHGARAEVAAYGKGNNAKSAANPLFMIINHQSPHTSNIFKPYEIPSRYLDLVEHIDDEERRNHAALVASLDEAVGRVVEALDQEKVNHNRILVLLKFVSESGICVVGQKSYQWKMAWLIRL